jgi:rhodanese-related sulfurtransferase
MVSIEVPSKSEYTSWNRSCSYTTELIRKNEKMRLFQASSKLAFLAMTARYDAAATFSPKGMLLAYPLANVAVTKDVMTNPRSSGFSRARLFSSAATGGDGLAVKNIGRDEMEEIVEDYEEGGRQESGYVIIDVREAEEIAYTGKVSPNTLHVPLGVLAQYQVFNMDDDEFEEVCGFIKPDLDETLVFTCAAGIRSMQACNLAARSGYSKLINYKGGANEWFLTKM